MLSASNSHRRAISYLKAEIGPANFHGLLAQPFGFGAVALCANGTGRVRHRADLFGMCLLYETWGGIGQRQWAVMTGRHDGTTPNLPLAAVSYLTISSL